MNLVDETILHADCNGYYACPVWVCCSKIWKEVSEIIADCMIRTSDIAEGILSEHTPATVKDQCADIAKNIADWMLQHG